MLLNFDPFRAIVLRDRLLFLVPDGADSILVNLERRVRGGVRGAEDEVFGQGNSESESVGDNDNDNSDIENDDMSFELVCLDAVIQSVTGELQSDFEHLKSSIDDAMDDLRGVKRTNHLARNFNTHSKNGINSQVSEAKRSEAKRSEPPPYT